MVARLICLSCWWINSTSWSALRCPSCLRKRLTMRSRLPERRPPAGRCFSTNSVADGTATSLGREGGSASAGGLGVRVLDGEAPAHVVVDKVDLGTLEIRQADGIDQEPDAVHLKRLVRLGIALAVVNH